MNTTNNLVLDFTIVNGPAQDVAVMPANLAKKLLQDYANRLTRASAREIIDMHIVDLSNCKSVPEAIELSLEFTQTRQLINNIVNENWDAYSVSDHHPELA